MKETDGTIVIQADPMNAEAVNFSDIIENITYTPLTSDVYTKIYGDQLRISVFENHYVLYQDAAVYENVYVYGKDGRLINKISFTGEGPGKVVNGSGHQVNYEDKTIEILDSYQQKLVTFDLLSGLHLGDKSTEKRYGRFVKSGGKYVFYMDFRLNNTVQDTNYNVYITDNNLNLLSKHIPIPKYLYNYGISEYNFSNTHNESTLLKHYLSPELHQINDGEIRRKYRIDLGEHWVSQYILDKVLAANTRNEREKYLRLETEYIYTIFSVIHSEQFVIFNYSFNSTSYWVIYNKNTKSSRIYGNRYNDYDFSPVGEFKYWPKSVDDGKAVFILSAENIRYDLYHFRNNRSEKELERLRNTSKFAVYESMVDNLPETSDLVLAAVEFKF